MFQIDLKGRESIYEQVVKNVKRLIFTGILKVDEKLPSVRELSRSLTVNPNTVQKAYRELERQGFIYTVAGRGCFVSGEAERPVDEERAAGLFADMRRITEELLYTGVGETRILAEMKRILEDSEWKGKEGDPA